MDFHDTLAFPNRAPALLHRYTADRRVHQASVKPHMRAASSTSPSSTPSALLSPVPRTTASHTTRAAFLSALLRNCTTVLNRDTSAKEHMIFLTASLSEEEASASTGMSEARRAGSREAPKSTGRDIGWIGCRQMVRVSGEKESA
jgi:hypothetical protein